MNERERRSEDAAANEISPDALEERLRTIYLTVYPPAFPPVKPSEKLHQRVAEITTRQPIRTARPSLPAWIVGWWHSVPAAPRPCPLASAGALAGVVLLTLLGLTLVRPDDHRSPRQAIPLVVKGVQPERPMAAPGSVPRLPANDPERRIVDQDRVPPRRQGEGSPPFTGLTNHGTRRGIGGNPSARPNLPPQDSVIDDLVSINRDPEADSHLWGSVPQDEWEKIEARVGHDVRVRDDFVQVPLPRIADVTGSEIPAAVATYKRETEIVDPRLSREVTCAFKATALSNLCERLRSDTGIALSAGQSVADEKVTLFCEKQPLRDVMRQLSRPFGYAWLRSRVPARGAETRGNSEAVGAGAAGEYRYELVQDLRSQLLEEELRNRDRDAALIALDQEMQRYRPYLSLSPEEARARATTASPAEKWLLDRYAHQGWGPVQMYFRLSPQELATLRTGQQLLFSQEPRPQERPLPPDLARGVFQSMQDLRFRRTEKGYEPADARTLPEALPPANIPEARVKVTLTLNKSDLGQISLRGATRIAMSPDSEGDFGRYFDPIGVGVSPAVRNPQNASANARLAHDPALRPRVSIRPEASCRASAAEGTREPKVTTADALEALHQATGLPIVADYYTRLYAPSDVSVQNIRLFDALNQLADTMRLRWSKEGTWLQFRSTSFYDDRLKEVPNRLLTRWSGSRKEHGALTLEDLLEIVQLSDTQLDAGSMAEGAKICFGLAEWDLARSSFPRPHLRYLAGLTPAQRQQAQSAAGLAFTRMSLPQQQGFIGLAFGPHTDRLQSLEDLAGASLQVDYSPPGRFEWGMPKGKQAYGWMAFRRLPVRERTREAALQSARQIDLQADATQITPTEPAIRILYNPGANPRLTPGGVLATATGTFDLTISRASP
jgi:hypothetical protein